MDSYQIPQIIEAVAQLLWPVIVVILIFCLLPLVKRLLRKSSHVAVEIAGTKLIIDTPTDDAEGLANRLRQNIMTIGLREELIRGYKTYLDAIEDEPKRLALQEKITRHWLDGWPELSGGVELLKRIFQKLGHYKGNIDDLYDRAFDTAIREFQHHHHLVEDGVFGEETYRQVRNILLNQWIEKTV